MKKHKLKSLIFFVLCLLTMPVFAQADTNWLNNTMFSSGKINVVVGVVSVIFILIIIYLVSIDRRLKKMEENNSNEL